MAAPVLPSSSARTFRVLVLPGDHVGPEVMAEAVRVLDVVQALSAGIKFEYNWQMAGGCSIDKHGTPITDEVLAMAKESDAVLFGSVGGPEW
jgi:3-isopropylmalate dehydrogenase